MNYSQFTRRIAAFEKELEQNQLQRRKHRIELTQAHEENAGQLPNHTVAFSPDVQALLDLLVTHISTEKTRYAPPPPPPDPALITPQPPAPAPATPAPVHPSAFVQDKYMALTELLQPRAYNDIPVDLPAPAKYFVNLLQQQMGNLTSQTPLSGNMTATVLPRLTQARQAIYSGRMKDALTILRTVYKAHSHSHMLLFLLSQFLYMLHGLGEKGTLPEARELAQKSIIATDKVDPQHLLQFRFESIVTELGYDPERALSWMRDTGMLALAPLQTAGLLTDQAIPLRGWIMLAQIPPELWDERELSLLHEMVKTVPGGALLYLFFFRNPLNVLSSSRKEPLAHVVPIERMLQLSHLLYTDIATPLTQLMQAPRTLTWTIRTRFAMTIGSVAAVPAFDHVLLHIALDGRTVSRGYPDAQLHHALAEANTGYWYLWAGCLSPMRETRLPHLIPAAESFEDIEIFDKLDTLLNELRTTEQGLIKQNLWNDLLPWMTNWQMDHLLAAGSGSSRPRGRFAPTLPPYSNFYRRWSEPAPTAVLASEIINENAKRGAFASMFEVQAAFAGAIRLILDPAHGLVATQSRALAMAKQANPAKYGKHSMESHAGGIAKVAILALVLVGGVGGALNFTANMGQAIGLSLVMAGVVGMMAVQLARPGKS